MPRGSIMYGFEPEHEVRFDPEGGHNHDGINSAPVKSGAPGGSHGLPCIAKTTTVVECGPGVAVDVVTGGLIQVGVPITADISGAEGPGGVDSSGVTRPDSTNPGTTDKATMHNLYLIQDPEQNLQALVWSDQWPAPDLSGTPFDGYTQYRLIAMWREIWLAGPPPGGPAALISGKVMGEGATRVFHFTGDDLIFAGGAGAPVNLVTAPWPSPAAAPLPLIDADGVPLIPLGGPPHVKVNLMLIDPGPATGYAIADGDAAGINISPIGAPEGKLLCPPGNRSGPARGDVFAVTGNVLAVDVAGGPPPGLYIHSYEIPG